MVRARNAIGTNDRSFRRGRSFAFSLSEPYGIKRMRRGRCSTSFIHAALTAGEGRLAAYAQAAVRFPSFLESAQLACGAACGLVVRPESRPSCMYPKKRPVRRADWPFVRANGISWVASASLVQQQQGDERVDARRGHKPRFQPAAPRQFPPSVQTRGVACSKQQAEREGP